MEHLEGILNLVDRELESIHKQGKFRSREDIDTVYKLIDIAKDIHCIWDYMEDEEEDERNGYSYARGRRGNVRRDSMGRYSRRYPMGGYSREGGREEYLDRLHEMMDTAPDEKTRQSIHRMIKEMESM